MINLISLLKLYNQRYELVFYCISIELFLDSVPEFVFQLFFYCEKFCTQTTYVTAKIEIICTLNKAK